ncbi:MAG: hypothetical protein JKX83_07490 [Pseudomonadales bacterium]|nr:hypothetical protein [Pseudomonadales bacterium]
MKLIAMALTGFIVIAISACGSTEKRRSDHVPPALAVNYCEDPNAGYEIGRYLAKNDYPLVSADMIDKCSGEKQKKSADAYHAGVAKGKIEFKCDPQKGLLRGQENALAQKAANARAYCDDEQLGEAFAAAYDTGYRNGVEQRCNLAISATETQGRKEGVSGRQQLGANSQTMQRCPDIRRHEVQRAYAQGIDRGKFEACANEIGAASSQGLKDGIDGRRSTPTSRRCPKNRQPEINTAYSGGYVRGDAIACNEEIGNARKQGLEDGYKNRHPVVPSMYRCGQPRLRDIELGYSEGFASGARDACQDELSEAIQEGRRDAAAGKAAYPPAMKRCGHDVAAAFGQAYSDGYYKIKEANMMAACPAENEAYDRGVNDALDNNELSTIQMSLDCAGRFRNIARQAYREGVEEGKRKRQLFIAQQDNARLLRLEEQKVRQEDERLRQSKNQAAQNYIIEQQRISANLEASRNAAEMQALAIKSQARPQATNFQQGESQNTQYTEPGVFSVPIHLKSREKQWKIDRTSNNQSVKIRFSPKAVAYSDNGVSYIAIETHGSYVDVAQGFKNNKRNKGWYIKGLKVSITSPQRGFKLHSKYPATAMGSSSVSRSQGWSATSGANVGISAMSQGLNASYSRSGSTGTGRQVDDLNFIPVLMDNGIGWNVELCNAADATGREGSECTVNSSKDLAVKIPGDGMGVRDLPALAKGHFDAMNFVVIFETDGEYTGAFEFNFTVDVTLEKTWFTSERIRAKKAKSNQNAGLFTRGIQLFESGAETVGDAWAEVAKEREWKLHSSTRKTSFSFTHRANKIELKSNHK